jgi:hypothetical protein
VLQHQPSKEIAKAYVKEFIRVIKPEGQIVFQLPYRQSFRAALQPRRRVYSLLRMCGVPADFIYTKLHLNPMRGICVPADEVMATVSAAGGHVVQSYPDSFNAHSMSYVVKREVVDVDTPGM